VRARRQHDKQQTGNSSSQVGGPKTRLSAVGQRSQSALAAGLGKSTALSRATSGNSIPDGDAKSAATIDSSQPSTLGPDAAAVSEPKLAYSVNDAARLLSISRSTMNKLIKLKMLKTIKLLGKRLIPRAAIEDLLAGRQ
jgi:excisionase family DNA binding protein